MYLTTTLASLPAATTNYSSLQTINLQRKPLPPLPISHQRQQVQQTQYIQRRDQQQPEHTRISKNSSIISHEVSLLEQVPVERASEFAAHMTCFLWFGDYLMDTHTPTSIIAPPPPPGGNGHRRYAEFKPRDAFKKFCKDVISATQVSHSVILLSLLYIHRMKINNPTIKGQNGSEYRTFTVALMLANKFLDDNTYTNKTWSEVTNIPVSEINTMEMEFLSSLDYELYVSERQYFEWVKKMDSFVALGDHDEIPVQSMSTGFKRSAEQAFVDGMMISPPKRPNVYPVYSNVSNSQQQLVVQTSQAQYTQIAYPTPPQSTGASQVAYYNLSSQQSSNYGVRPSYSVRTTTSQTQYTYPISSVYYTAKRNLLSARSGPSGFPISSLSFQTTVV
ncbi:19331_t:CDS:2 [Rhizophagus irregularis]|nr:19331_t:CDS:2 [Rhizophagus irregularis]